MKGSKEAVIHLPLFLESGNSPLCFTIASPEIYCTKEAVQ